MADRDYALGIGIELNTSSAAEFEQQVRARLEKMPPLQIKVNASDSGTAKVTEGAEKLAAAVKQAGLSAKEMEAAFKDLDSNQSSVQRGLEKTAVASTGVVKTSAEVKKAKVEEAQAIKEANSYYDQHAAKLEKLAVASREAAVASKQFSSSNDVMFQNLIKNSAQFDKFVTGMKNVAGWAAEAAIIFGGAQMAGKAITDALHSQQEQVIQGFYYQGQGKKFTPELSAETMKGATDLARTYGEEVIKTQEAIGLWAKVTNGELGPSLKMANDSLKLNAVTGMNLEEIYRSTIAVMSQYHLSLARSNDLYNVGVGLAAKYGGGFKMLGGESQDAARQMIEGMDGSAAAAANFGMTFERSAGLVTALLQTGNESGTKAGGQISTVLQGFEKNSAQKAFKELGIAMQGNDKILDQVAANWNTKVPGMGKTLHDVLEAAVSRAGFEPLNVLIHQVGLIDKATKEAYESEKAHPIDKMWNDLNKTDLTKFNQVKADFETLSITVVRNFIPAIGQVSTVLHNIAPLFIQLAPEISEVLNTFLKVSAVTLAWEALKAVLNLTTGMIGGWITGFTNLGAAMGIMTVEQRAATMGMSNFAKAGLEVLTENGTVSSEMVEQVKIMAANIGVSLDSLIRKWLELKGTVDEVTLGVDGDADAMALNQVSVAAKIGLTNEQIGASFVGLEKTAVASFTGIAAAALRLIPVIGQIILVGAMAKAGVDFIGDKVQQARIDHDRFSPTDRALDVSNTLKMAYELKHAADANAKKAAEGMETTTFSTGLSPSSDELLRGDPTMPGAGRSHQGQVIATTTPDKYGEMAQKQYEQAHDLFQMAHAYATGQTVNMENFDANQTAIMAELKKQFVTPGDTTLPGAGGEGAGGTGKTAGASTVVDAYADIISAKQQMIDITKGEVDTVKGLIAVNGNSSSATKRLEADYQAETKAIKDKMAALRQETESLVGKKGSELKIASINNEIGSLGLNLIQIAVEAKKAKQSLNEFFAQKDYDSHKAEFASNLKAFNRGDAGSGSNLVAEKSYLEGKIKNLGGTMSEQGPVYQKFKSQLDSVNEALDGAKSRWTDFDKSTTESLNGKIFQNESDLGNVKPWDKSFASAMRSATDEMNKFNDEMTKFSAQGMDQTQMANLQALEKEWYASAVAVATYERNVAAAKASTQYIVGSAGIDAAGSGLSSWLVNQMSGNAGMTNQINALQSQLGQIDYTKSMIGSGPDAKYHTMQVQLLSEQAKKIQDQIKKLEDLEKNPPIVKKIFQEMEKSLVDTFIKKFEDSIKQNFLDSILGKQKTENDKLTDSMTQHMDPLTDAIKSMPHDITVTIQSATSGGGTPSTGSAFSSLGSILNTSGSGVSISSSGGSSSSGSGSGITAAATAGAALGSIMSGQPYRFNAPSGDQLGNYGGPMDAAMKYITGGGGSSSGLGFGNGIGADGSPSFGNGQYPVPQIAPSGGNQSWLQSKLGSAGKVAMGASMVGAGYSQGGLAGGLEAGLGAYSAITGLESLVGVSGGMLAALGPYAIAASAIVALFSAFHPHYSPSANPDMYAGDGFAQGVANAQGQAYTQADGWVYEDANIKSELGGVSQLQYLTDWYNKYPGGQGLNSDGMAMWSKIGALTGNGKGIGVEGLHQGNIFISDGKGHQVGMSGNWQDVLNDIDQETTDLYTMLNADNSLSTPIISVNAYGGSGLNPGFSPWTTPGLNSTDIGAILNAPYGSALTNGGSGSGDPTSGQGGLPSAGGNAQVQIGDQSLSFTNQLNVDGAVLAQVVNAYNNQRQVAGFQYGT